MVQTKPATVSSFKTTFMGSGTAFGERIKPWVVFAFLAIAFISGLAVAVLGNFIALGLAAMSIAAIILVVWQLNGAKAGVWVAMTSMALLFILPIVHKTTGIRLFGLWQVLLVLGGIFGIISLLKDSSTNKLLLLALVLFGFYLLWASVSAAVVGRSNWAALSYQFISNLKPVLLICFGYYAWRQPNAVKYLWFLIDWYWIPALIFIAFEWSAPGAYYSVFGGYSGVSSDQTGLLPSRAMGTFEHPAFLASVSANFAFLCLAKSMLDTVSQRKYQVLTGVYCLLLFASMQRQELVGCLASLALIALIIQRKRFSIYHAFALLTLLGFAAIIWMVIGEDIYREAGMWGIGTVGEISHPRAQQYAAAFFLANDHMPFGTGLGTFGGAGAEKFDLSLYYELGFGRFWWFGNSDFLLDTYWPNPIAEGGWIGFAALMAHYILLAIYAIKSSITANNSAKIYWVCAGVGTLFILVNGISSPAFQDPRLFYWAGIFYALARHEGLRK